MLCSGQHLIICDFFVIYLKEKKSLETTNKLLNVRPVCDNIVVEAGTVVSICSA